ncbi:MAG: hypothetical protein ACAI44_12410, partial [Candidatus Sericytochromatia bacterium]
KTLTLSLTAELQGRLKQNASQHGMNQGDFTRRLLDLALEALEQGQISLQQPDQMDPPEEKS